MIGMQTIAFGGGVWRGWFSAQLCPEYLVMVINVAVLIHVIHGGGLPKKLQTSRLPIQMSIPWKFTINS